jgi:hypothetical protein
MILSTRVGHELFSRAEGYVHRGREVPRRGKRHNRGFVNQNERESCLDKGGRPATSSQSVAGGRSLLGRIVMSTAALFFYARFSYHEPLALRLWCSVNVWVNVQGKKLSASRQRPHRRFLV